MKKIYIYISLSLSGLFIATNITHKFNLTLITSKIAAVWRPALVIRLHRCGSLDYCPISKISPCAKILENLADWQLRAYLDYNHILQPQRSGFRLGLADMYCIMYVCVFQWATVRLTTGDCQYVHADVCVVRAEGGGVPHFPHAIFS